MSVQVDIHKKIGSFSLSVKFDSADETTALLGASGCGKSMTLRCIAGIDKPDFGRIVVDGKTYFDSDLGINLPPQQRGVGLLFQNYALFPNMTVRENIAAGARREKDKKRRADSVAYVMKNFGIEDLAERYPSQISGGQQQRAALARILVSSPNILLLDEPFSALDSHLRFRLEQEMREVIREFGKTVVLVSHDRDEVYRMSNSIAIMKEGRIEQFGNKFDVFKHPLTKNAALLTGCKNISEAKTVSEGRVYAVDWDLTLKVGKTCEDVRYVGVRMHDIRLGGGENSYKCRVAECIHNPFSETLMLKMEGAEMKILVGMEVSKAEYADMNIMEDLTVSISEDSILVFDK